MVLDCIRVLTKAVEKEGADTNYPGSTMMHIFFVFVFVSM